MFVEKKRIECLWKINKVILESTESVEDCENWS